MIRFKIYIFIIFLFSACTTIKDNKITYEPYSSTGFALIYDDKDLESKIISSKLDNTKYEIAHDQIKKGTILRITNPDNKKTIELKISKKINYPSFFNILITQKVADKLQLNTNLPLVEINERVKNKSFIAEKAVTFSEEQKVSDKAPITKVKIDNISLKKNVEIKKVKKFSIIIGIFYSEKSANILKNNLEKNYVNKGILKVKKLEKNKFQLFTEPNSSINALKKLYFELNKYGFEDLDILQL